MIPLAVLLIAYLLGAIPFGYLLVKWKTGADVRAAGSGNIGATNVMRTTGRAAGVVTLLLDIAKGYAAVWIAGRLTGAGCALDESGGSGGDGRPRLSRCSWDSRAAKRSRALWARSFV